MNPAYLVHDPAAVFTPALAFYPRFIRHNIARMVEIAGTAERVRPHAKTHKTREIVELELAAGITKHKCATLAEAEVLASAGAPDVFWAYNPVGPNCDRLCRLIERSPGTRFSVTADHPAALRALSASLVRAGQAVDVVLDLDVGMHRTGVVPGPDAVALYQLIAQSAGLIPGGLHVYDGHNHQENLDERTAAVDRLLGPVLELRVTLEELGLPVPRLIMGGTPTFPLYAKLDLPGLECSPGTLVLHDNGYGGRFPDLTGFTPAALVLTRVVSRPTPTRLTLDLGYKAVASDPPAGKRCVLLNVPDAVAVMHSEEHLVVETPAADRFVPGDVVYALPTHVCPTVALHHAALLIEDGVMIGSWAIAGRDRV